MRYLSICVEAEKEDRVSPIEVEVYEEVEGENFLRYTHNRTILSIFTELKKRLEEDGLLPEEYFSMGARLELDKRTEEEFPSGWIACYAVTGASEGHYIHVDVLNTNKPNHVFVGKTFKGLEFAVKVASACMTHLPV